MSRWAAPDLIASAMVSEAGAAERLIAAIWPRCFSLAATVIGHVDLAQDAAQETCVIVHQKISGLRNAGAFDSWLYRIVMRESARVRRRHAQQLSETYKLGFAAADTASIDVWRALAELPPALREVTVLFYFDDLKTEEIADILRIPHATVRTRLARARERLRALLGNYGDTATNEERKSYVM